MCFWPAEMVKAQLDLKKDEMYNCYKEDSFGLGLTIIYAITKYIFANLQNIVI